MKSGIKNHDPKDVFGQSIENQSTLNDEDSYEKVCRYVLEMLYE